MAYKARQLINWDTYTARKDSKDKKYTTWVPARPVKIFSLKERLVEAFGVLTGKYDALDWEDRD